MSQAQWTTVDEYIDAKLVRPDPALAAALAASAAAGLPSINVTPSQGKLLGLMARLQGARTILEVGTLGGYSTIWLARALPPGGRLVTLELDPRHAEVARDNIARAGLADQVEVRLGPALDSLQELAEQGKYTFDFVFIDADKPNNANYFTWALRLTRPGSVIVVDNVVRAGKVIDDTGTDPNVEGARQVIDLIAAEGRVAATAVQTVGAKGYDGFIMALVIEPQ